MSSKAYLCLKNIRSFLSQLLINQQVDALPQGIEQ